MSNTITLQSNEGENFEVTKEQAEMSETIKGMLEDLDGGDGVVPLPEVSTEVLKKVVEYCEYHVGDSEKDSEEDAKTKKEWDTKFCDVEQETLFAIILAANYLDIKPLLDITCKTVANMIKGKTPEEIRKTFNIENDFTPEEEAQIRKENEWCEEK